MIHSGSLVLSKRRGRRRAVRQLLKSLNTMAIRLISILILHHIRNSVGEGGTYISTKINILHIPPRTNPHVPRKTLINIIKPPKGIDVDEEVG